MGPDRYENLSPEKLNQWLEAKRAFCLIDTLTRDHFLRIRLPNAKNACVFEVTFVEQVKAITEDREADMVLYGSSPRCLDSITAASKLHDAGYKHIYLLRDGIEGWRLAGFAFEGEETEGPDDPQTLLKLENRAYLVDTDQSIIEWRGRNSNTTHFGTVRIAGGKIAAKDGNFTGVFDIDMNSITNLNLEGNELQPVLIAHLKSDDFFLTKLFPTARFAIASAKPVKEPFLSVPNYEISGNLELRGVKAPLDIMSTVTSSPEKGLVAEAHFDIDRTKWGIIYGSARFFEHLGMHLIFDLISVQIRIVAG